MSFKLGQLIGNDEEIKWVKIRKKVILCFSNYLPLQIWTLKFVIMISRKL